MARVTAALDTRTPNFSSGLPTGAFFPFFFEVTVTERERKTRRVTYHSLAATAPRVSADPNTFPPAFASPAAATARTTHPTSALVSVYEARRAPRMVLNAGGAGGPPRGVPGFEPPGFEPPAGPARCAPRCHHEPRGGAA